MKKIELKEVSAHNASLSIRLNHVLDADEFVQANPLFMKDMSLARPFIDSDSIVSVENAIKDGFFFDFKKRSLARSITNAKKLLAIQPKHFSAQCDKSSDFMLEFDWNRVAEFPEKWAFQVAAAKEILAKNGFESDAFKDSLAERMVFAGILEKWQKLVVESCPIETELERLSARAEAVKCRSKALNSESFIQKEIVSKSLQNYEKNKLFAYFSKVFGEENSRLAFDEYKIGTSNRYGGGTIFWQIDTEGVCRSGQIIEYCPEKGKRVKGHQNWAHSVLKLENFELSQCYFGEHLLNEKRGFAVGVVESEKTALMASIRYAHLPIVWLATNGKGNFHFERAEVLKGRKIIAVPDHDISKNGQPTSFEIWTMKAREMKMKGHTVEVLKSLEKYAETNEKPSGYDLADFIIEKI